jgi:NitT/TauT family transport system substrate-binding protein
MRVGPTIAFRCISALLTGLLALACFGAHGVRAQAEPRQPIPIRFAFDRPIDAGASPVLLASANGLFSSEGLAVTTDIAGGSADAIARVASGAADFARPTSTS